MPVKLTHAMIFASASIIAALVLFVRREEELPPALVKVPVTATVTAMPRAAGMDHVWLADPMAASTPRDDRPAFVVQRQKKMQALMTGSPLRYYSMRLGELQELARHGDADAMMQLAEQYTNEDRRLRADPDYPVAENARELAKQYLSDAFLLGRIRAAALLSKQLFDENQIGEAYAWRLVSERFGDSVNPVWGSDTNQFASLSDSEKTTAQAKAESVANTLLQNKLREFAKAHQAAR